jgi:hypothetical protein
MVEAFDINILHIENIRNRIERMDETCRDIVDDMNFENHDKDPNIPETFITRVRQVEKELTGIDKSICSGISELQDLRFNFVPTETPKKSSASGKRKRGQGNCGANHMGGIKKERRIRCRQKDIVEIAEQII